MKFSCYNFSYLKLQNDAGTYIAPCLDNLILWMIVLLELTVVVYDCNKPDNREGQI